MILSFSLLLSSFLQLSAAVAAAATTTTASSSSSLPPPPSPTMDDQFPPSDLETASVAGEATTNASTEMAKPEDTPAAGIAAKPQPAVKKAPTEEQKAAYKRRLDELKQFGQEFGFEEEPPSKKQRQCPDLPAVAVANWNSVRDGLDTQIAEIKKCRATEFNPARDRLREAEKKLQEMEKEVKGLRAAKNKAQAKINKLDADIKKSKTLSQIIEERK